MQVRCLPCQPLHYMQIFKLLEGIVPIFMDGTTLQEVCIDEVTFKIEKQKDRFILTPTENVVLD